ncbi:MAG: Flp pilus assembly protein CpaB [Hyphomicrobiales bacterium]|nr:MAG: Flp pilus assembly protein CpaB [Hyphomicrobiales bacterium]
MKTKQLVVLGVALAAALGLAGVARNMMMRPAPKMAANIVIQKVPTIDVLVANESIPMGSSLKITRLAWEEWPQTSLRESFITRQKNPDALEEYSKQIARSSFFEGEPIRAQKLVKSDSGYLSAILPAGKRAVAVRIQAETSAGGFILPNDHVDVIMSYKGKKKNEWVTDTILTNVRVLAIDQLVEEKDGEKFQVGETATLELTADQAEILTVSKQISNNRLTLALRSVADSNPALTGGAGHLIEEQKQPKTRGTIRIVRYGQTEEIKVKHKQ